MYGLNKMCFDVDNLPLNEVTVSSWEDYSVVDKNKLHTLLSEITKKNYYSPDYYIWRNFLYRYLYSHTDEFATNTYASVIKNKDLRATQIYNKTSFAALAAFKALNTDRTPIFNNVTMSEVSSVTEHMKIFIDDFPSLRKQLLDNNIFSNIIYSMLNMEDLSVHFSAFRVYILRKRYLGFRDIEIEQAIKPKITKWINQMFIAFEDVQYLIGDSKKLFEFYTDSVKKVLKRLTDYFLYYLSAEPGETKLIQNLVMSDLDNCNNLTASYVQEFMSKSPVFESIIYSPYYVYNLLYYYYSDNSDVTDTCVLFAMGDRLFKQAMNKIDDTYYYLINTDIGMECINLMHMYLNNLHMDEYDYKQQMNNYLDNLYERGFISRRTLEVNYL